jgi:putative radical SAM enzyme (TIGR03279 family)
VGVERTIDIANPSRRRRTAQKPDFPGTVEHVADGSLAQELGIEPGDRIVNVNGNTLRDAVDFQYYADVEEVVVEVERADELIVFDVERDFDEPWGISFETPTFDGIHICDNSCPFCFIKQIPKGMRRSLYVMDDDYRYSMLYGNFVTLTNLTEDDWRRIEEQRLGPLYVSVHATNPELRTALVGNSIGAEILNHLGRLEAAGIDYHAQLVLCPGVNDGPELDRSLEDLANCGPHLRSIAGVPVGLTRFGLERQSKRVRLSRTCMRALPGATLEMRRYEPHEADAVIEHAEQWQTRFRRERGETFFYLGDEFYLMTGRDVPPLDYYAGFPQLEDGIGITRRFLDDVADVVKNNRHGDLRGQSALIACGTLIGPTMERSAREIERAIDVSLNVLPIENTFFGGEINISGLLTGKEVIDAVAHLPGSEPVCISSTMVSRRTNTLLDDMRLDELKTALGRDVIVAEHLSEVLDALASKRVAAA